MYYSAAHDLLIYKPDSPLAILSAAEGARRINGEHVAVPLSLANLQALANIDVPVIAPMQYCGYDWPIRRGRKPLLHQKVTANYLALHKRCFCLNDMGTMKTLSALWAADYLMELARRRGELFRALISCPLSITTEAWGDTIWKDFLGRRTFQLLVGSDKQRLANLAKPVDFYIVNHDGLAVGWKGERAVPLKGFAAELDRRSDIRLVIIDECRAFHNASSIRNKVARRLAGQREYLWMMTGTPTPNGPLDAFGQAKLLNNANGESWTSYRSRVQVKVSQFKWVARQGSSEAAKKLLSPAIRYAIEDCVDLPPCVTQSRDAEMSAEQKEAYKRLKNECVLLVKSGEAVKAVNQAALRIKLIQVACGCVYDDQHNSHEIDASPRIAVLREVIEECREKVIVFAPLTNVLNMLYWRLHADFDCEIINGAVSQNDRTRIFRNFQQTDVPRILLADPATMAHGVTLTAATSVIWYAPTDKTELYIQANKRVDRPGQTKTTTVVQISSTTIEKEIYLRLENNQSMQDVVLKLAEEK